MSAARSYLDHNATTPVRPEVAAAMARALALPGNASSVHAEGRAARSAVERAREEVAALVGGSARNVIFTSGGTEAANTVLTPSLRRVGDGDASLLLVGATEHACVLDGHRFATERVEKIPVDDQGLVDLSWLAARLRRAGGERVLVSLQAANNETGVIQPVAEAAALVHHYRGLVHADAVQAAGKIPCDIKALGADVLTLSAHKLGGPKGVGAIVLASDGIEIGDRLVRGGGQERGYRAGTENVAGIAGFGAAVKAAMSGLSTEGIRLESLRRRLETGLRHTPGVIVFSEEAARLPNTTLFTVPGLRAETAVIGFDLAGIAVSSGSACSSGKVQPSHVLEAMGFGPDLAQGAVRLSLGWSTSETDIDSALEAWRKLADSLLKGTRRNTA